MNNKISICYHGKNCQKFKVGLCKFHSINDYNELIKELSNVKILSKPIKISDDDFPRLGSNNDIIKGLIKKLDISSFDYDKYRNEILDYIKKDEFIKITSTEHQRDTLGRVILILVRKYLDKDELKYLNKITGMLIDKSIFNIDDIIVFIENEKELSINIISALELLKSTVIE